MRAIWLPILALATGCTAVHKISLESDPPGAHVEYNGIYVGVTPLEYEITSPYAEKIWPRDTILSANMSGWQGVSRSYVYHDELPEKVVFVLQPITNPAASDTATTEIDDEYETLEEQKNRFRSRPSEGE